MKGIESDVPVYLWLGNMDMRVGFDRLSIFVREQFGRSVTAGGVYVFFSRSRDRVRLFYWDLDGYAIWTKRLEASVYRVTRRDGHEEICGIDLAALLSGVDLARIKFRKDVEKGSRREEACVTR